MTETELKNIEQHLFGRYEHMGGIDRDIERVKDTGEVFTPTPLVERVLDQLDPAVFSDSSKTFIDPACGDGQFLASVLYRKLQNGIDFAEALSTIYGIDLMPDNVNLCKDRLLCGKEYLRAIVDRNIVEADGLTYHMKFDGTPAVNPFEADLADRDQQIKKLNKQVKELTKRNSELLAEYNQKTTAFERLFTE